MNKTELYQNYLAHLKAAEIFRSDFPEETAETTLNALWNAVADISLNTNVEPSELPDLSEAQKTVLEEFIEKRCNGTPLAYLTGRTRFMGLELFCEPGVLIPRAETELLCTTVVTSLSTTNNDSGQLPGIDVGCGCGNLSCGIASNNNSVRIHAIDMTDECVSLTRKNVAALQLNDRISVYKGDMFSPLLDAHLEEKVDFIVSNPPYVPSAKLQSDLTHLIDHEPEAAFNGGIYGFAVHQRLLKDSLMYLKPGGFLFFEFGAGQDKQVGMLCRRIKGYTEAKFINDRQGVPRVAILCKLKGSAH